MNIKTIENFCFLDKENTPKMVKMLKDWLNLDPIKVIESDDGGVQVAIFLIGGIKNIFISKSEDATNSAMKVDGSTSALTLVVETKKEVDDLYKKAVDLGFTKLEEPVEVEEYNLYGTGVQDKFKNHYHIFYYM